MKLEVGKKYRTVSGRVVTAKRKPTDSDYPFIMDDHGFERFYTTDGFYLRSKAHSGFNIIEEIQETKMKLEVGKKYRTVDGTIMTVVTCDDHTIYPFIAKDNVDGSHLYTEDGFYLKTKVHSGFNIIEEIKENTMFNKEYKYLCMDAEGYQKAAFNRPTINTDMRCWLDYEDILQVGLFNLGTDWKESLREIMYNDDGSIYLRKPRHEFKVDDKVLVRNVGCDWVRSHFFCYRDDGGVVCYVDGKTSFTTSNASCWDEIKPYEEE